ncbi:catalase [Nesterenkonia sp. Act20]|uniref:catalase n=1 Tax=Nesterenkonia sp. Act20 TaxID=1483432 RepID=UPI001C46D26F|nr:catalase [Nesterenkonia sp. Act20]
MNDIHIPGAPQAEPPAAEQPVESRVPLPPKQDQRAAAPVSPTGAEVPGSDKARAQQGEYLTTAQGARVRDTDHSLKAGSRGPVLLQDHHLREKIMHFDHERIPERVVHARGAAAHGIFESYGTAGHLTQAKFLAEKTTTEVFTRFSTVLGSRGSADTVRDTRGFSTKFYTEEGNYDLVGNNIPVFFIQDAIKFPDIIHAGKPHPDREIPQAQSAHDTFWDFVSLHTEAQHHTIWNMSDRGIPRSLRMMEGFGVHTFRLINAAGESSLVKFHWKPKLGVHSITWEEALMTNGVDPDFHRRDLADAIEAGAFPEWELGVQVFPDSEDQMFHGIDLLDPTKFVPEELAEVQMLGKMTLNANPQNYFAETEQVAFHPGHLVPGIEVTNDPLLQGRLFSYLDTQITRLGGPNFAQIPINRPRAAVNDMLRDGYHQTADHAGVAPYHPNSFDGGNPYPVKDIEESASAPSALIDFPEPVSASVKIRKSPQSFDDHYTQVTMFYRSLSRTEQLHVIQAYTFELGKCYEPVIKERQLQQLTHIDADLAAGVAEGLGLPVPEPLQAPVEPEVLSPTLSQLGQIWPIEGRLVGVVVDESTHVSAVQKVRKAIDAQDMVPLVVAPTGAPLSDGTPPQRTYLTARSIEFDAIVFLTATAAGAAGDSPDGDHKLGDPTGDPQVDPRLTLMAAEAYRHGKAVVFPDGSPLLSASGVSTSAPGVLVGTPEQLTEELFTLMGAHRAWERFAA